MDSFLKFSKSFQNTIHGFLGTLSAIMLIVMTLFALLEIVRRYIFSVVFEWGQDFIIVGMVSAVALFFCVTQTKRSHLVMNVFVQLMHSRGYLKAVGFTKILVSAVVAIFCASISVTGWPSLTYAIERDLSTYSLIIPLWPFYLILMIGFGLTALVAFLQTIEDIISFSRGEYLTDEFEITTDI
jgi:TRAP-type C4-dicarboxylate transport system permease small subunit